MLSGLLRVFCGSFADVLRFMEKRLLDLEVHGEGATQTPVLTGDL